MTQNLNQIWEETQINLKGQMPQQTFDTTVRQATLISLTDTDAVFHVKTTAAKEWLEARLASTITRAISFTLGYPVEITFINGPVPDTKPIQAIRQAEPVEAAPGRRTIGQLAAQSDYFAGFFDRGGAGYSMLHNYAVTYWASYLGEAFILWKKLEIEDKRYLRDFAHNYWTPPTRQRYTGLAQSLNKVHPRSVSGGVVECWHSIRTRQAGDHLECCHNPDYAPVKTVTDSAGCGRCLHWQTGALEILHREGLAVVEEINAESPRAHLLKIQIWRMLPIMTPIQIRGLHAQIQAEHSRWIAQFGRLFNLESVEQWEKITERSLVNLMPGWGDHELTDNFNPSRKFKEL
jgi:hypothetical protein